MDGCVTVHSCSSLLKNQSKKKVDDVQHPPAPQRYWHMNYHIEHHMYAAVPCYNLKAAHNAIKHDLPPTPNGLWEVWLVITAVLEKQAKDPAYVMTVDLPSGPVVGEAGK